jgi:hypothetical protein
LRRCAEGRPSAHGKRIDWLAERRETEDFLDGFGRIGHHRGLLLIFSKSSGFHFSRCDEIVLVLAPLSIAMKG